jgi:hypothetical protein
MGDCSDICGCRPDEKLCDRFFKNSAEKSFLSKIHVRKVRHCRPDGRTSAVSNFHIRLRASKPWGMSVWTAELQHTISISAMRVSGP